MTQTTGAISSREYFIETSPDGAVWTDRSGNTVQIIPGPGTRMNGKTNTFGADTPIITVGERDAITDHVNYVYSEVTSELFEVARAAFESAADFYIRWAPKGGQSGEFRFTSSVGKIISFDYPGGDANNGAPVILGFDILNAATTKAVVP